MSEKVTVVMMLKAPVEGEVKTRLAASMGNKMALRIYRWLVERQIQEIPERWNLEVSYTPVEKKELMEQWLGPSVALHLQRGEKLGDRLLTAVNAASFHNEGKVIAIGGDCPGLTSEVLQRAGDALEEADVVLGPARDGGYTLIGMKQFYPELFAGISWGTDRVLKETITRLKKGNYRFSLLEELEDVDEYDSWMRAKEKYFSDL
jgi:rSAM/selenodomain-associated transferase 1